MFRNKNKWIENRFMQLGSELNSHTRRLNDVQSQVYESKVFSASLIQLEELARRVDDLERELRDEGLIACESCGR